MNDSEFERLVGDAGRELQLYLRRWVRCPDTAADLAQETLLRVAAQPGTAGRTNLRAYLYRTARNLAIDHHRQERRRNTRPCPPADLADLPDEAPAAERTAEARQRLAVLSDAIGELPALTQRIFALNRIEGHSHAETARRLGISESSVQKHLARALQHAMQRLRER